MTSDSGVGRMSAVSALRPGERIDDDLSFKTRSGAIASGGSLEKPCGVSNKAAGCGPILTWLSSQRTVETLPFRRVKLPASRIGVPSRLRHIAPVAWASGTGSAIAHLVVARPLALSRPTG